MNHNTFSVIEPRKCYDVIYAYFSRYKINNYIKNMTPFVFYQPYNNLV